MLTKILEPLLRPRETSTTLAREEKHYAARSSNTRPLFTSTWKKPTAPHRHSAHSSWAQENLAARVQRQPPPTSIHHPAHACFVHWRSAGWRRRQDEVGRPAKHQNVIGLEETKVSIAACWPILAVRLSVQTRQHFLDCLYHLTHPHIYI